MATNTIHVVMSTSHWQGARQYPVAIAPSAAIAEHVADLLSTCSFCCPGRTGNYMTGDCYSADTMRVQPAVATLPEDATEWERADADAWLENATAEETEYCY